MDTTCTEHPGLQIHIAGEVHFLVLYPMDIIPVLPEVLFIWDHLCYVNCLLLNIRWDPGPSECTQHSVSLGVKQWKGCI